MEAILSTSPMRIESARKFANVTGIDGAISEGEIETRVTFFTSVLTATLDRLDQSYTAL